MKRNANRLTRAGLAALVALTLGVAGCSDNDSVTGPGNPNPGPINPGPGVEDDVDNGLGNMGGEKRNPEQGQTDRQDPSLNQ